MANVMIFSTCAAKTTHGGQTQSSVHGWRTSRLQQLSWAPLRLRARNMPASCLDPMETSMIREHVISFLEAAVVLLMPINAVSIATAGLRALPRAAHKPDQ